MNEDDIEFGNYGRIARRSWWVLAIGAAVGILLALFFLPGPSQFFESRVSVLLVPGDSDIGQGADLINEDTEIGIAVSQVIGDRVVSEAEDLTLDEWRENIVISACLGNAESIIVLVDDCSTRILEFSYQGNSPEEAQGIVQLTADTYLAFRSDREQAQRAETIANLEAAFADLEVRGDTERAAFLAAEEDSLEAGLIERRLNEIEDNTFIVVSQLTELQSRSSDVGSLLGEASVPEAGSSGVPRILALLAGAFVGLLLGATVAVLLDRRDRRVGDAQELEQDLGVPVLGDIPRITQDSPALVTAVSAHTPGAEAFRRVAAAALATRNGVAVSSIAIVGANEEEGRTTTTINLALAMAQNGRDVLVVNADRRNIVIDRIFGLSGEIGLNDFLRTSATIEDAHMAIDNSSQRLGIRLLSTGTGSEASVSSSGLQTLIAAAKERNMIVIFDTPPALTHAGGLQIAAISDAVYVVAASGRTRRSELSELRTQLDNVQAYLVGAIFNRTSRLSLLPAGAGDIATVAVPTGIPGNTKNGARNAFDTSAPDQPDAVAAPKPVAVQPTPEAVATPVVTPAPETQAAPQPAAEPASSRDASVVEDAGAHVPAPAAASSSTETTIGEATPAPGSTNGTAVPQRAEASQGVPHEVAPHQAAPQQVPASSPTHAQAIPASDHVSAPSAPSAPADPMAPLSVESEFADSSISAKMDELFGGNQDRDSV